MLNFMSNLLAAITNGGASPGSDASDIAGPIVMLVLIVIWFLFLAILYVFNAICLMMIAKKTNTVNGWWAWIPFLNLALMCKIAGRPLWWVIFFLFPMVNIVINIWLWMEIAQARGKPNWIGLLFLIPFGPFIVPGYLAFSK